MRKLMWWLSAPWKRVRARYLTPRRKAVLLGFATSIGVLYGGWLLLVSKESLDDRNVVSVIVAPDRELLIKGTPEKVSMDSNDPRCFTLTRPSDAFPAGDGCWWWRVEGFGWQGTYRTVERARPDLYRENTRGDAVASIRDDVGDTIRWLVPPGGMLLAVLVGVSTGYHYLRRETRGEDS